MRHAGHERRTTNENRLEVLPDLLVSARRTCAVEDRDIEREFARLEAHVEVICPVRDGNLR